MIFLLLLLSLNVYFKYSNDPFKTKARSLFALAQNPPLVLLFILGQKQLSLKWSTRPYIISHVASMISYCILLPLSLCHFTMTTLTTLHFLIHTSGSLNWLFPSARIVSHFQVFIKCLLRLFLFLHHSIYNCEGTLLSTALLTVLVPSILLCLFFP